MVENTIRRGRRHKQLLDDLKEKRRYCNFKAEALDLILCITRLGRGKKGNTAVNLSFKFTHVRNQYGIVRMFQNISPTNNLNGK